MCKHCLDEWYKRNPYMLIGNNDNNVEVKLEIKDEDGLEISASWDQYENNTPQKWGFAAMAIIYYCPWCGRKLKNE